MQRSVHSINTALAQDAPAMITRADADYAARLEALAADIREHRNSRPLLLLAGPSGSGKTTTALMVEHMLDSAGFETHTLSMDDFFYPLSPEEQRLAAEEKLDLESPGRVDTAFLNETLQSLLDGKPTPLPHFSFRSNTRTPSGVTLTRKPGELIILEGIHALNPEVITLPEDCTARLYVSVRTRLEGDNGSILHPSRVRLLRRMLRDKLYRSRNIADTLRMFRSVQRGEERYIMPYKHRATYEVDTFCPYEVSVYKTLLEADMKVLTNAPEIAEIAAVWETLTALSPELVPPRALIREFIGDSAFYR